MLDMDLSALEEDNGMSGNARLFDLSDSDEFPDLHELVRARFRGAGGTQEITSCESDYSDSDMDAMVRDAHVEEITPTEKNAAKSQNNSPSGHVHSTQLTLPSKRKRSIEVAEDLTATQITVASFAQSQESQLRPQVLTQG